MIRNEGAITRLWTRLGLLGILLIAFALRAYQMGDQEISGDEAFSYFFSLPPVREIIQATIDLGERNPPGGFLVLKAWMNVAGHGEFALRFVGFWFGVLAVALLYRLGRQLRLPARTAMLAAGLLTLSPFAVAYSQSPRAYSASMALGIASTVLALAVLNQKRLFTWLGYVLVSWLGLHAHYMFVLVLLAQNAFALGGALLVPGLRQGLRRWVLCQVTLVLFYSPWLIAARSTLIGAGQSEPLPGFAAALLKMLGVFAVGETLPVQYPAVLALLAGALLAMGGIRLALAGPSGRQALLLLSLWLAFALGATRLGALNHPAFDVRYLITALPAFYLLLATAALGSNEGTEPRVFGGQWLGPGTVLLAVLLLLSLLSLSRHYGNPAYSKTRGWRELATSMARLSSDIPSADVRLIQNIPDPALWYYYRGSVAHLVLPPAASDVAGADDEAAKLARSGVQRVVLSEQQADWWDGNGIAEAALAKYYAPVGAIPVGGWLIHVYARPATTISPVGVSFANGVTLAEAAPSSRQLIPGGVLVVYLRWRGDQDVLTGTEKITLQVLDSQGVLVAQTDRPLGPVGIEAPVMSYGILVPQKLSPGRYRLIVALYDPGRPHSPRLQTTGGADYVDLGEVNVQ